MATSGMATKPEINEICKGMFSLVEDDDYFNCPTKYEITKNNGMSISGTYSSDQLVGYDDISVKRTHNITINVYNGNNAQTYDLDAVAYYGTSSTNIPTSMGSVNIGKISGKSWSGNKTLTITLPSSIDYGATQLWFNIGVGQTGQKRAWSWSYDNSTYYNYSGNDAKTGYTDSIPVQPGSTGRSLLGRNPVTKIYFKISD